LSKTISHLTIISSDVKGLQVKFFSFYNDLSLSLLVKKKSLSRYLSHTVANPSHGWPLTLTTNSIVLSLTCRIVNSPLELDHELTSFVSLVKLAHWTTNSIKFESLIADSRLTENANRGTDSISQFLFLKFVLSLELCQIYSCFLNFYFI
jgi:hypothetical protein